MWGDASENDVLNGCENLNLFLLDFYKFEFLTAKFEFLSVSRFIKICVTPSEWNCIIETISQREVSWIEKKS